MCIYIYIYTYIYIYIYIYIYVNNPDLGLINAPPPGDTSWAILGVILGVILGIIHVLSKRDPPKSDQLYI